MGVVEARKPRLLNNGKPRIPGPAFDHPATGAARPGRVRQCSGATPSGATQDRHDHTGSAGPACPLIPRSIPPSRTASSSSGSLFLHQGAPAAARRPPCRPGMNFLDPGIFLRGTGMLAGSAKRIRCRTGKGCKILLRARAGQEHDPLHAPRPRRGQGVGLQGRGQHRLGHPGAGRTRRHPVIGAIHRTPRIL